METGYIYGLVDPRNQYVRYVGQTIGALQRRHGEHITCPVNALMRAWIAELKQIGLKPEIRLIEEVDRAILDAREAYWIIALSNQALPLLNVQRVTGMPKKISPRTIQTTTEKKRNSTLILDDVMFQRLGEIAKKEDRTLPQQLEYFLRQSIREYEESK